MMPRPISSALAGMLIAVLAACSSSGGSPSQSGTPSTLPCGSSDPQALPGCLPPGSAEESVGPAPSFTTGPTGTPIGDWSLTLTGGPSAGTYSGRDEMVCQASPGAPTAVAFNPVGSPPIGHVDAITDATHDGILVSAGGLEAGGEYAATDGDTYGSAELRDGPTITNGVLHMKIFGTVTPLGGETRTMLLEVTCPLFPPETDG